MARLVIVLDVPDVDPTRTDPHDLVADLLDDNAEHVRSYGPDDEHPETIFLAAEWLSGGLDVSIDGDRYRIERR